MKRNAVFTEPEARTKWCPHVRHAAPVDSQAAGTAGNRFGTDVLQGAGCIASECTAWRWFTTHIKNPENPSGDLIESADTFGYCGLAGAP